MRRAMLVLLVFAFACSSQSPRHESKEDGLSLVAPPGWTSARQLGSLVFSPPEDSEAKTTIAIRSVEIAGAWEKERTPRRVAAATERVLRALPQAEVAPGTPVKNKRFVGVSFDLTFVPPNSQAQVPVQRRHVVWIGKHRVIHVMHTGPVGELDRTDELFSTVVDTVREEV